MEAAVEVEPEGSGEKRRLVEDGHVSVEGSPPKRMKSSNRGLDVVCDGNVNGSLVGNVKKVAEIVLVLAGMGKMRSGRGPTEVEKELMAVARGKLAKLCEGFAPKDVFPRDAFGSVIDDLGLNKLKEQRLGFRPPKISIAEKLMLSKRKMEKSEDFSLPSTTNSSQRPQANSDAAMGSRGVAHAVRMPINHMTVPSGSFQSASPLGHSSPAYSTSSAYQLPSSEVRPVAPTPLPSSQLRPAALPRPDGAHLKVEGKPNGTINPSPLQANYSGNSTVRTPTWAVHPHSVSSAKIGSDGKVPANISVKVDGARGINPGSTQAISAPLTTQTTTGKPRVYQHQGTNHSRSSMGNRNAEISKIIQKLLQPSVPEPPIWNPPSRDYMTKALTCQMCLSAMTEIDGTLVCDACEKGFHLKCLQKTFQKGVPIGEWHCGKCLSLSHGKPIPPKYGRVMRNTSVPKVTSHARSVQSTTEKKVGASDEKFTQPKVMVNGNTLTQHISGVNTRSKQSYQKPGLAAEDAKGLQDNSITQGKGKLDEKASAGAFQNNLMKTSVSPLNSSERSSDKIVVEMKSNPHSGSEMARSSSNDSTPVNQQQSNATLPSDEVRPINQPLENIIMVMDSKDSRHGETSTINLDLRKEQETIGDKLSETTSGTVVNKEDSTLPTGLHAVNWVGDAIQVLDGKTYYQSCSINDHVYKIHDHAIVCFNGNKLIPSKLQALWEDNNTNVKWVTVNRCYFPDDLPEAVGRPCGLECSEVYESNCGSTLMAGLIQGPCDVLPPRKFAEESERRNHLTTHTNDVIQPLYQCRWFYDESKGLFRDVSC